MDEVTVRAPFAGYVSLTVRPGDRVERGDRLGAVEAVKMEAEVRAPAAGRIRAALSDAHVEGGDALASVEAENS